VTGFHESLDAALTRAEQTDAAEVEALAALVAKAHPFWSSEVRGLHVCIAKDILASDWLAADRAAQRRLGAEAVVAEFVDWVATQRAYNGAIGHGQALYDHELNRVLPKWAQEFDAARAAAQQVGGEQ